MNKMRSRFPLWFVPMVALGAFTIAACNDMILDDRALVIEAFGQVEGFAFLDLDGSGTLGQIDEPFPGLTLELRAAGSGGLVQTATTDASGSFLMDRVPAGSFELVLDPEAAPDTVEIYGLDPGGFVLLADSIHSVEIRAAFPTLSLAEVRALEPGKRVITHGIALNSRRPDGDGVVHLQDGSVYLRAIGVDRENIGTGDSVRFIGRTARDAGQPILEDVRPFRLVSQAVFVEPKDVTSAQAASAQGGSLDAALVRIRNAVIEDTVSVGTDLIVTADDGTGPVDLVLRNFVGFNTGILNPDSTFFFEAVGLLVPIQVGQAEVRWRMTPRANNDLIVRDIQFPPPVGPPSR